ncbi:MAG: lipopolysaccharide transport periplasmic protein LptA [Smithella sp.]
MMNKKIYIFLLFFLALSGWGFCEEKNILKKQFDEPMEITSDRMEAFNDKKLIIFSGGARITQGKSVLKANRLLLYYKGELKNENKKNEIRAEQNGILEKIEAQGNVSFTREERTAHGDQAIYYMESNKIVLTGNALLNEGKNSIKGERVTVFINENRGLVESDTQSQVKAIIYPQSRKKTEKK